MTDYQTVSGLSFLHHRQLQVHPEAMGTAATFDPEVAEVILEAYLQVRL